MATPAPPPAHVAPSRSRPEAGAVHRSRSESKPAEPTPIAAPVAEPGFLSLRVTPWGEVLVDGMRVAETSALVRHPLAARPHQVVVRNTPLGKEQTLAVNIAPGATEVRRVDLTAPPP